MTEIVSATNTPPMMNSTISCRAITATVPSAAPSESAPTSPMNTSAGYALNQRNPRPPPASAAQNAASSPAPGMYGNSRYLENPACPVTYANMPSAPPTMTAGMIASPSSPSGGLPGFAGPPRTRY